MAYAAVASLLQTVDIILDHHHLSISPQFEHQIKSIHQHTCSLRSFIEGSSDRVNNWEETIREVTVRAEDIIELLLSDSLLGTSRSDALERGECEVHYSFDELEEVIEEMESIVNRVMGWRRVGTGDGSDKRRYSKGILVLFNWNPPERRLPDAAQGINFPLRWFQEYLLLIRVKLLGKKF